VINLKKVSTYVNYTGISLTKAILNIYILCTAEITLTIFSLTSKTFKTQKIGKYEFRGEKGMTGIK
jgi:hypothetical protein